MQFSNKEYHLPINNPCTGEEGGGSRKVYNTLRGGREAGRQAGRQTGRQAGRQGFIYVYMHNVCACIYSYADR